MGYGGATRVGQQPGWFVDDNNIAIQIADIEPGQGRWAVLKNLHELSFVKA